MKPDKEIIVNELLSEMRDWGISYTEAKAINDEKWRLAPRTLDRYWAEASSRFKSALESEQKAMEEVRLEALKDRALKRILSKDERMEILTQIASGELTYEKEVPSKFGPQTITAKPDFAERRAAVAELNKMDGEYAPVRKDITSGGEKIEINFTD